MNTLVMRQVGVWARKPSSPDSLLLTLLTLLLLLLLCVCVCVCVCVCLAVGSVSACYTEFHEELTCRNRSSFHTVLRCS